VGTVQNSKSLGSSVLRSRDALQQLRVARRHRLRRTSLLCVQQERNVFVGTSSRRKHVTRRLTRAEYVGIFKPPNVEREKLDGHAALNDKTL
jgi:hypothetical protein